MTAATVKDAQAAMKSVDRSKINTPAIAMSPRIAPRIGHKPAEKLRFDVLPRSKVAAWPLVIATFIFASWSEVTRSARCDRDG